MLIANVTEKFDGKIMMGEHVHQTSLMLQEDFTKVQISADSDTVVENSTVDIECGVKGGSPKPYVTFLLMHDKGLFRYSLTNYGILYYYDLFNESHAV